MKLTRMLALWSLGCLLTLRCLAQVLPGIDVLAQRGFKELQGKRVGLIANAASVNRAGRSSIEVLRNAAGVRLVALFAAEHGIYGDEPAGKEVTNTVHRPSGLPVYSLYGPGPTRKPTPAMLKNLDVVVYDIQDAGVRPYTYISTLGLAMEACAVAGIRFMVLDRPNPLGGLRVQGPTLDPRFRSFVGQWEIPLAYGLTPGELAGMINGEGWNKSRAQLTVIPLQGWKRTMDWKATGLRWTPTSPNVRTVESVSCLPATGLLGDIGGVSIGMGTDTPFQYIGAPWIDRRRFADFLNTLRLPGIRFDPVTYEPTRGAFKGQVVHGVRLRVTDAATAPLIAVNFHALDAVKKTARRDLFKDANKAGKSFSMFDKLLGGDATRRALQNGASGAEVIQSWRASEAAFKKRRQPYLLYP